MHVSINSSADRRPSDLLSTNPRLSPNTNVRSSQESKSHCVLLMVMERREKS